MSRKRSPIMGRQKVQLLKRAWRKGGLVFLKQLAVSVRDRLWTKREMVYRMTLNDLKPTGLPPIEGLTFRRITQWDEFQPQTVAMLEREKDQLRWGQFEWLTERGYGLWAAEINGELAALRWWRHYDQCDDYSNLDGFSHLVVDGTEFDGGGVVVFPTFRGNRIQVRLVHSNLEYSAAHGVKTMISRCRDYHTTTLRLFSNMGWEYLGYISVNRISKKRRWNPINTNGS